MKIYDALVVGAGPNGLVAANRLADAGWSVLILEAQTEIGGAVKTSRDVHPDYLHDTFSAFYPLAAASPALKSLSLEEYGLIWSHAPAVLGNPLPGGHWSLMHPDREVTAGLMDAVHGGDGESWLRLCETWDRIGGPLVDSLMTPFPPVRNGLRALKKLPHAGGLDFIRTMLTPASELGRSRFAGQDPQMLFIGNAAHADMPLGAAGSGAMGLLLTMLAQDVGFPVPRGGAGELTLALRRRFESLGGDIRASARVDHIVVANRRAVGVKLGDGEVLRVRRAVLADVIAPYLYGRLLDPSDVPRRIERGMRSFSMDPAVVKVDWALDGAVPWASRPLYEPGAIHIADSVAQAMQSHAQVSAGLVPASPFVLAGQMTTADPTRSPPGTESMWAYAHVPQNVVGDAADAGVTGRWDADDCNRFADRVQARFESLAPGFSSRVIARRVLGPHELEKLNANLLGGAVNGGTAQLHQQVVLRPTPGLGRAETPIHGLYLASASAHPGGGVHGAPGMNAARAALAHHRLTRFIRPLGRLR